MINKLLNTDAGLEHAKSLADEVQRFPFGDVAVFFGKSEPDKSLLIATHTDKPTLVCSEILNDGTARASLLGKLNAKSCANAFTASERGTHAVMSVTDSADAPVFYLDFGTESKADSEKRVSVGDVFHFDGQIRALADNSVCGFGISFTASALALITLCEILAENRPDITVYAAFIKEGSFSFSGYAPAALKLNPSSAVCIGAVDVSDAPNIKLGMGAAVRLSDKSYGSDKHMSDALIDAGGVPAVLTKGSCAASKIQAAGVPASELDIPAKHLETNTEIINLDDIYRCAEILRGICRKNP